jgi:GntR family transcriptional regulator/MocR family aminotransferase
MLALTTNHPTLVVKGTEAGLNLLIPAPDASAEAAAIAAASAAGIGLDGLILGGHYESSGPAGILVGYGATPQHAFRASVEALILALSDVFAEWSLLARET